MTVSTKEEREGEREIDIISESNLAWDKRDKERENVIRMDMLHMLCFAGRIITSLQ